MTPDEMIAAIKSAGSWRELDELARRYWGEKEEGDQPGHFCGQPNSHCNADCMARAGARGVYDMPLGDLTEEE